MIIIWNICYFKIDLMRMYLFILQINFAYNSAAARQVLNFS